MAILDIVPGDENFTDQSPSVENSIDMDIQLRMVSPSGFNYEAYRG